jgi:hypothetical protein
MSDPIETTQHATQVPWGTVTLWVLGALAGTGTVLGGAFKAMWTYVKNKNQELVDAYKEAAKTAGDRAAKAEEREDEARRNYDRLKGEFKATAKALRQARRQCEDEYSGESSTPPHGFGEEEYTGNYFVNTHDDRAYFEEQEREREWKRLNPEADQRERERGKRVDPVLRRYLGPDKRKRE